MPSAPAFLGWVLARPVARLAKAMMVTASRGSRLAATVFRVIRPTPMVFKALPQAWVPAASMARISVEEVMAWPAARAGWDRQVLGVMPILLGMPVILTATSQPAGTSRA